MARECSLVFLAVVILLYIVSGTKAGFYEAAVEYDHCRETRCGRYGDEDLLCSCDRDCTVYGDCCGELNVTAADPSPLEGLLECRRIHLDNRTIPGWKESFWMVSQCPLDWFDESEGQSELSSVSDSCSNDDGELPPVTDLLTGLVYKNEYCALCHRVQRFIQWGYELFCSTEFHDLIAQPDFQFTFQLINEECLVCGFKEPELARNLRARPCFHQSLVTDQCLDHESLVRTTGVSITEVDYQDIVNQCKDGPLSPLVSREVIIPYRNQYCAICSGLTFTAETLSCVNPYHFMDTTDYCKDYESSLVTPSFGGSPSFTIFIDVNRNTQTVTVDHRTYNVSQICRGSEVFDLVLQGCRKTICEEIAIGQYCTIAGSTGRNNNSANCDVGYAISLNESEFLMINNNSLQYGEEVYEIIGFINGSAVICVNFSQNGTVEMNSSTFYFSYPPAYVALTNVGCSLSILGCAIVLVTYIIFKDLRTLPGKILMNLSAAILATSIFILLTVPHNLTAVEEICQIVAILSHWLVLSEFSWMTIMSFELARTMLRATRLEQTEEENTKRKIFLLYFVIGWSIPTLIATVTIIINYTTEHVEYGMDRFCWIGDTTSFYAAFLTPILLSITVNGIAFIINCYLLIKAQRSELKLRGKTGISYLRVHLSVFSVSGLTWISGFIAVFTKAHWAWYLFIILNKTQGFTICATFVFTWKILNLYRNLFWPRISRRLSFAKSLRRSTQVSSLSMSAIKSEEGVKTDSTLPANEAADASRYSQA